MSKQLILKDESAVLALLGAVADSESIKKYSGGSFEINSDNLILSTIQTGDIPVLGNAPGDDAESATAIFKYLGDLNRTSATDARLWTYLTHFTFKDYTQSRWPLKDSQTSEDKDINKAKDFIVERWFFYRSKAIAHNSIARLWWAAYLTKEPWAKYDLGGLEHDDPYIYTKTLFSNQNVQVSLFEREIFSSPILLIAALEFIRLNPDYASVKIQALSKELNLIAGVKKIGTLDFGQALELISHVAARLREL